ncbi:MAG: CpsD/CapB family tyrosine-protein kinase [Pseudomonadota bacterium]
MEKLQQALEKARTARTEEAGPPAPAPRARTLGRRTAPREGVWSALRQIAPDPGTLSRNRIVAFDAGPAATHFDILRTKILLQMRKNGWRRLAITSPTASCGKTTTALNLALGLSRQPDLDAMLLEMDLRKPNMGTILGYRPEADITQMLTGEVPFAEQAVRIRGNVAIAMARRASNDPTRYMLSGETIATVDTLERTYDPSLVIFDLPPLLVSDDTRAFLGNVDCALMVTRAERTSAGQIDACEREIAEHTNMLGIVLNHCRFSDDSEGYDYDYGT